VSRFIEIYMRVVVVAVRVLSLVIIAFTVFWTMMGIVDLTVGMKWGYSWKVLPAGPAMALFAYGFYRFAPTFAAIAEDIRRSPQRDGTYRDAIWSSSFKWDPDRTSENAPVNVAQQSPEPHD
jgi:hypothetical protein